MQSHTPLRSVVVVGGCGFYGHHLVRRIRELEPCCSVAVIDLDTSINTVPGTSYHCCDISDHESLSRTFESLRPQPRVVFHAACPPSTVQDSTRFWKVNVDGTRSLLLLSRQTGVRAFIFVSTSDVVHDPGSDLIEANETMPILKSPRQRSISSLTKGIAEEDVLAANRVDRMLTLALRPCITIGPANPHFMGRIVHACRAGAARFQMGDGNMCDFMHVDNLVHACLLSADRLLQAADQAPLPPGRRVDGEAFNIANEERVPFWDFTLAVSTAIGKPLAREQVIKVPRPIALLVCFLSQWLVWLFSRGRRQSPLVREDILCAYTISTLNVDKATSLLGYRPVTPLKEGMQDAVAWYMEHEPRPQ